MPWDFFALDQPLEGYSSLAFEFWQYGISPMISACLR
jgi:hypothetical protein